MKIRKTTQKDKKIISDLYYQLHQVEEKENREKGLLVPIEKSKIKPIFLVAEEKGEVVGFIWAHFIQYGFFKYGTIDEFFVKKEFRGKGIGTTLLRKAIKELEKLNPKMILVGTEKENKEAIKLYQKVGFELGKRSLWFYWNSKKESLK
ncbi:MAG TPA: GNAT family N-acetyltransferase [Candidatus Paceibacterota bacterium]|jgi:PhnO protein|nr:GNAT family N-acetyltransferase [Candidatus Paceibacterota bacterium]